jgi:L,D-transpeptidase YbiS
MTNIDVGKRIDIEIDSQFLRLTGNTGESRQYPVSTAANGVGEQNGSFQTPGGRHIVRAMIGRDAEPGSIFVGRRPTGEMYTPEMRIQYPDRDWILTRILWLSGIEPGFNRHGEVDTMRRYIYIHGSPEDVDMNEPGSAGCIRMRNEDIIELFNLVEYGIPVTIHE